MITKSKWLKSSSKLNQSLTPHSMNSSSKQAKMRREVSLFIVTNLDILEIEKNIHLENEKLN